ncbi:MAG: ribonuclease Z [Actinomycetota bacterium]|jgi:ribonuclease Z|nr:ribonuclease Z [Actinomycetota bacterium]
MRELVVLGTASQAPTRHRNHNGYLLRWDGTGVLFDPGEGTQRQMTLAHVAVSAVHRICVTHFHGDHCLGLPGVVQRLSLDAVDHPVEICYPAGGQIYVDRLLGASVFEVRADVRLRPVHSAGTVDPGPPYALVAERLDHGPETIGWRLVEPDGRTMMPDRLAAAGVSGPSVGELQRAGKVRSATGRVVHLHEMSVARPGQVMAFVMDTGLCDGAFRLAERADLLVCEATFAEADAALARTYRHLTARQAAQIALESGARRLVITHFSQRYPDERRLLDEARAVFPGVVAAHDLEHVPVPARRPPLGDA